MTPNRERRFEKILDKLSLIADAVQLLQSEVRSMQDLESIKGTAAPASLSVAHAEQLRRMGLDPKYVGCTNAHQALALRVAEDS